MGISFAFMYQSYGLENSCWLPLRFRVMIVPEPWLFLYLRFFISATPTKTPSSPCLLCQVCPSPLHLNAHRSALQMRRRSLCFPVWLSVTNCLVTTTILVTGEIFFFSFFFFFKCVRACRSNNTPNCATPWTTDKMQPRCSSQED
jgi:hypothetical protein